MARSKPEFFLRKDEGGFTDDRVIKFKKDLIKMPRFALCAKDFLANNKNVVIGKDKLHDEIVLKISDFVEEVEVNEMQERLQNFFECISKLDEVAEEIN